MGRKTGKQRRKSWRSKRNKSIGSQVGSALGGHMSRLGKEGKLGSKYSKHFQNEKGNLTYSGFKNMLSSFFGGNSYANAMGQVTGKSVLNQNLNPNFVKRMEKLNLDVTNPQKGLKWTINNQKAIDNIQNERVRNWLNKNIPKAVKDWKINHQMHYTPKIKPGDPRWTAQGTGSAKIDKNTEKYLDWMARANPQGHTISDYNKLYKKQLDSGVDLFTAMKFNPAETGNFYALIDDTKKAEEKALDTQYKNDQAIYNNNKNNMSQAAQTDEQWLQDQYMSKFGRSADTKTTGGANYWLDKMSKNPTSHTRDEVARMLGASAEAKSFASDGVVRPGGVRRDQSVYSQGVAGQEYAKHFQPGGALAGQNSADTLNQIAANTYKPMPEAKDGEAVAQVMPGVDGGYFQFADQDVVANPKIDGAGPVPGTDGWWNQFADADAFKKFLQGDAKEETKSDGMGDFMKFMMLMNVMGGGRGGGGGGYGGSQFGYGGMNPGGVQAAYDPMKQLQGMGTWFKDNFGSGSATTANLNTP